MTGAAIAVLSMLAVDAPAPEPTGKDPAPLKDSKKPSLIIGADAIIDLFPSNTDLFTGARLNLGFGSGMGLRALAVLEGGYATTGLGFANQGGYLGAGAQGELVIHDYLVPFARLMGNVKVVSRSTLRSDFLSDQAIIFSLGVRVLKFIDLHASLGGNSKGRFAGGAGIGLGWRWSFATGEREPQG